MAIIHACMHYYNNYHYSYTSQDASGISAECWVGGGGDRNT
jgi:hypothetical protein